MLHSSYLTGRQWRYTTLPCSTKRWNAAHATLRPCLAVVVPAGRHFGQVVAVHQHHGRHHVSPAASRPWSGGANEVAVDDVHANKTGMQRHRQCLYAALLGKAALSRLSAITLTCKGVRARRHLRHMCGAQVVVHALHIAKVHRHGPATVCRVAGSRSVSGGLAQHACSLACAARPQQRPLFNGSRCPPFLLIHAVQPARPTS